MSGIRTCLCKEACWPQVSDGPDPKLRPLRDPSWCTHRTGELVQSDIQGLPGGLDVQGVKPKLCKDAVLQQLLDALKRLLGPATIGGVCGQ